MHDITIELNTEVVRDTIIAAIDEMNQTEGYKFSYTRDPNTFDINIMAPRPEDFYWLGHRSHFIFQQVMKAKK